MVERSKYNSRKVNDEFITPPEVYEIVKNYFIKEFNIDETKTRIIRPFYPGGDFEKEDYSGDCLVLDNPPFSLESVICDYFEERNIKYILFAPTKSLFTHTGNHGYVELGLPILYSKKPEINTSFITNLCKDIRTAPSLYYNLREEEAKRLNKKIQPKYIYDKKYKRFYDYTVMNKKGIKYSVDNYKMKYILSNQNEEKVNVYPVIEELSLPKMYTEEIKQINYLK